MPRTSPARPPRPRTRPIRTRTRKRTTRARNANAAAPNPKPTAANATDHNCAADVAAALARANALRTTLRRPGLKRGIGPGRAPTAPTRWRHTPRSPRRQPAPTTSAHAHQTPAAPPPPAPRPPDPQPDHEVRRHPHGSDYAPAARHPSPASRTPAPAATDQTGSHPRSAHTPTPPARTAERPPLPPRPASH